MALLSKNLLFLVNQFGQSAVLSKPTYGAYDPTTGTVSSTSTTTYNVKAYFAEFTLSELNNDNIADGDRKVLIPSEDTSGTTLPAPSVEDTITGVGDGVKIVRVQEIYSAEELVCYICQVRE
jgi:hypothetical protein